MFDNLTSICSIWQRPWNHSTNIFICIFLLHRIHCSTKDASSCLIYPIPRCKELYHRHSLTGVTPLPGLIIESMLRIPLMLLIVRPLRVNLHFQLTIKLLEVYQGQLFFSGIEPGILGLKDERASENPKRGLLCQVYNNLNASLEKRDRHWNIRYFPILMLLLRKL